MFSCAVSYCVASIRLRCYMCDPNKCFRVIFRSLARSLASLCTHRSHNLSGRTRVRLERKGEERKKEKEKEKRVWVFRRAVAFRFPGRNQSPLNRGEAEIRAPPRAVASIPPRLAPQPMPCPASCFSIVCFLFCNWFLALCLYPLQDGDKIACHWSLSLASIPDKRRLASLRASISNGERSAYAAAYAELSPRPSVTLRPPRGNERRNLPLNPKCSKRTLYSCT